MRLLRRWGPWALLLIVVVVALVIGVQRSAGKASLDARTMHIAAEVRCPVCEGQSAAQSQAAASLQIRNLIRQELVTGESETQILAGLVHAYGQGILEKPEASGVGAVVWVLPVLAVLGASGGLAFAFRRWRTAPSEAAPTDSDRSIVERALHGR